MYKLILKKGFEVDAILGIFGDKVLVSSEDESGACEMIVEGEGPWNFPFVESVEPYYPSPVDWDSQWELFGPGYKEGFLEVPVGNTFVKMKSGPGFGNLSHATTRLMLELMPPFVPGTSVLDIGTGSGVLALAAAVLGAKKVTAVDIDPYAVTHAQENAELNELKIKFNIENGDIFDLTLLNMIFSEQKIALSEIPVISGILISSGILQEEYEIYTQFWFERGWSLLQFEEKEGWLGFVFTK